MNISCEEDENEICDDEEDFTTVCDGNGYAYGQCREW